MEYILNYRSSRSEIWRWYWRKWRSQFWRVHVLVAAVAALVCALFLQGSFNLGSYAVSFLVAFPIIVVLFAAWPQFTFKPQERTLHVGPKGWSTQIGNLSSSRPWSDISSVQAANDAVEILSTTGNALIVPLRAFEGRAQMQQFIQAAQAWHREPAA